MLEPRKQNMTPEEQQAHSDIAMLSGEVYRLKDEEAAVKANIEKYEGILPQYKEQKVLLDELLSHIAGKRALLTDATTEYDNMFTNLSALKKEYASLQVEVDERNSIVAEIETLNKNKEIIQKDNEDFVNSHAANKKKFEGDYEVIKNNIKQVHESIGAIVSNL